MPPTLKELTLRYLRERLEPGELPPGSRLSELALSKEIGISRTPVREALNQLAAEGLVEFTPHAGAFVKQPDPKDVEELYELREVLESFAVRKMAERGDRDSVLKLSADCKAMDRLLARCIKKNRTHLNSDETAEQQRLDRDFHQIIIAAAGNSRLRKAVTEADIYGQLFRLMEPQMPLKTLRCTCENHRRIFEAIKQRRGTEAEHYMAKHIQNGMEEMLKRLHTWQAGHGGHDHVPSALRPFAG